MLTANAASPKDFDDKDEISSTYAEAVNVLSALGVIKGDDQGNFNPKNKIRRSEVATLIFRAAGAPEGQVDRYKDYDQFTDVIGSDPSYWFAGYVNYCAIAEYVKGKTPTTYAPFDWVTGYEVLAMILRVVGYDQNDEFTGPTWKIRTASTAHELGITKNISEGTLGQPATREQVAEMIFQAMQVPTVKYTILNLYQPSKVLIQDTPDNRTAYAHAIDAGLVTLPRCSDLMYQNWGIVGKSPLLTFDGTYGRPEEAWVTDAEAADEWGVVTDTLAGGGNEGEASMYVPNNASATDKIGKAAEAGSELAVKVDMTAAATYTNAVTECQVAKDVIGDENDLDWKNIAEVLNGNAEATLAGLTTLGKTQTLDSKGTTITSNTAVNHADGQEFDALHTSDKWIGATGRTTEIYDLSDYNVEDDNGETQQYLFVYVDTFLGRVKDVTEAIKDPNGHVIRASVATIEVGDNAGTAFTFTAENAGGHKKGDLVLVQTPNGGIVANAKNAIDSVATPEKTPLTPEDVPDAADNFPSNKTCTILPNKVAAPKRMTITATWGQYDDKTGIQTSDGIYYASNTFLAARTSHATVLADWYDGLDSTKGIVNSMIGKTFDVVFDQNGWIVGMDEVATVESNVGVITAFDTQRVGVGKYVTRVEAYMTDGQTREFDVVNMGTTEFAKIATDTVVPANFCKTGDNDEGLFTSSAAADGAWADGGLYGAKMGRGSLVMFKQCTIEGATYWYFADTSDLTAAAKLNDKAGTPANAGAVGTALAAGNPVNTGDALAIGTVLDLDNASPASTMIDHQLDDESVIFVAEPEYAYNTGSQNEGDNTVKYAVYKGFKKIPTITQAAAGQNILYQQLINNPEYVLVYPQQTNLEYIIQNQPTITVDDSYLVLSRGATFAQYSEYNVLKNGKADVLRVSNANDNVNSAIEAAMAAGDLLTVTGRNGAGYVIAADTVENLANATPANSVAVDNCGGVNSAATHPNPLVAGAAGTLFSENDGVLNFNDTQADIALTLADGCTVQLVNLGTGAVEDISLGVAKAYINKDSTTLDKYSDFTFELDQYGYVCSLYVFE